MKAPLVPCACASPLATSTRMAGVLYLQPGGFYYLLGHLLFLCISIHLTSVNRPSAHLSHFMLTGYSFLFT
jgi:hypothetical protein